LTPLQRVVRTGTHMLDRYTEIKTVVIDIVDEPKADPFGDI